MKYRLLSFFTALLLVISMAITPFTVAAKNDEYVTDSSDTEKVGLLEALGLMEIDSDTGFFWDDMPVKRSNVAEIICKMFDMEAVPDETPHFTDVNDTDRPYIETAVRSGYLSGYGDGRFGPDDYVTNMQLIKIFVAALGGEEAAKARGGFPNGYVEIGKMLGLINGKIAVNNSAARRIDVANIIYEALHAEVLELNGAAGGNIQFKTVPGYTFLTEKRNIYRASGIITKNEATALNRDEGLSRGLVMVGETVYYDNNRLADDYLGCSVECYVQIPKDELTGSLVYVHESKKNKTVTVTDEDIVSADDAEVHYYDAKDRERVAKISATYDIIYNGKAVSNVNGVKIERLTELDNADVKLIDNNDDGVYDVVIITEYITRVVYSTDIEEEKLMFRFDESPLKLEDSYYRIYRDGNAEKLDGIKPGDVLLLAISENEDGEKAVRILISREFMQGEIQSVRRDTKENKTYVIMGEKEYVLGAYCCELESKNKIHAMEPKASGTFYFDARGNIAFADCNAEGGSVAFLIDGKVCEGDDGEPILIVKLYNENRELKRYVVKEAVKINSKKVKLTKMSDEIKAKLNTPQLVKYSEINGELTEIVLPKTGYDAQVFSMDDQRSMTSNHDRILDDKYFVEPDAKIFYIPDTAKDDVKYDEIMQNRGVLWVLPAGFITNKHEYSVSLYDVSESGGVKYILIRYGLGTNLIGASHELVAVNKVDEFIDDDGEINYIIQGYGESGNLRNIKLSEASAINAKVAIVDEEKGIKNYNMKNVRPVKRGDVVQVHWDNLGRCDDMWIQHSAGDSTFYSPVVLDFEPKNENQKCIFGQTMFVSASNIIVSGQPGVYKGPVSSGSKYIGSTDTAVYKWTGKQYIPIDFDEIEMGDKVFAAVNTSGKTRIAVVFE